MAVCKEDSLTTEIEIFMNERANQYPNYQIQNLDYLSGIFGRYNIPYVLSGIKALKMGLKLINKHGKEQILARFPSCKSIFEHLEKKVCVAKGNIFREQNEIHLLKISSNQVWFSLAFQ